MTDHASAPVAPRTRALRRALGAACDACAQSDLLFLETWEAAPNRQLGATLRAHQIRRANPVLAAEIRAELSTGRPLTQSERAALFLQRRTMMA